MEKSLKDRWLEESLTDNTRVEICKQCKTCALRDNGDVWSNNYKKSCCQIYPYPEHKPEEVVRGNEECEFYEEE